MIKTLVIEDELLAAQRLERILTSLDFNIQNLAILSSVEEAVKWLKNELHPDLIFMDIQLGDGLSFDIFSQVRILCPVVFTTAYNEYSLRAFKVNSIDYLLKPMDESEVRNAVEKYISLRNISQYQQNYQMFFESLHKKYKERFMVKIANRIKAIEINSVLYFYSLGKATYIHTEDHREYDIEFTLDQLESMISPLDFFRINRKYIVHIKSIQEIIHWSNSRLKIMLKGCDDDDNFISRDRVKNFKDWLDH